MIQKPRFKSHFQVEIVEPDVVLLRSENNCIPLQGHLTTLRLPSWTGDTRLMTSSKNSKGGPR